MVPSIQSNAKARLPRPLIAAMLLQYAALGAVLPFVTLLFRDRGLGFSRISLVFLASSTMMLVFPFLWGMLADRFVPLNRLFAVINLLACLALGGLLVQARFVGGLIAFACYIACLYPTFSLLNALSFHHLPHPGENYGLLRAWGSVGWIVPFLPISLWTAFKPEAGLGFILWLGMGLCLVMALLSFWLPHTPPRAKPHTAAPDSLAGSVPTRDSAPSAEGKTHGRPPKSPRAAEGEPGTGALAASGWYGPALRRLLVDPNYLVVLGSIFLVSGSFSLLTFYSPPFLEDLGVPRPWIGPAQATGVLLEIVLFQWQPLLMRRWNYTTTILLGAGFLVLRHLLFGFLDDPWILSLSYTLAAFVVVFYYTGVNLLANAIAPPEVRATAQTLIALFALGLGPMFANWAAGRLAARAGEDLRPVFVFAACVAGLATLLIAVRGRHLNRAAVARRGDRS